MIKIDDEIEDLVVVKAKSKAWICKCKCGKEVVASTYQLENRKKKSCGCRYKNYLAQYDFINKDFLEQNYEKLNKSVKSLAKELKVTEFLIRSRLKKYGFTIRDMSVAAKNRFKERENHPSWKGFEEISKTYLTSLLSSAMFRKMEFELTEEYLWNLYVKQDKKCSLSNLDICFGRGKLQTASLDRIDSSKGYVEGNVQWVHKTINRMKTNLPEDEFYNFCKLIFLHNKEKYEESC